MPWMTTYTHISDEDALAYEEMLDQIEEADRQQRNREAYYLSFDHAEASHSPREAHHD